MRLDLDQLEGFQHVDRLGVGIGEPGIANARQRRHLKGFIAGRQHGEGAGVVQGAGHGSPGVQLGFEGRQFGAGQPGKVLAADQSDGPAGLLDGLFDDQRAGQAVLGGLRHRSPREFVGPAQAVGQTNVIEIDRHGRSPAACSAGIAERLGSLKWESPPFREGSSQSAGYSIGGSTGGSSGTASGTMSSSALALAFSSSIMTAASSGISVSASAVSSSPILVRISTVALSNCVASPFN